MMHLDTLFRDGTLAFSFVRNTVSLRSETTLRHRVCAHDVINFSNLELKSYLRFYPNQT